MVSRVAEWCLWRLVLAGYRCYLSVGLIRDRHSLSRGGFTYALRFIWFDRRLEAYVWECVNGDILSRVPDRRHKAPGAAHRRVDDPSVN